MLGFVGSDLLDSLTDPVGLTGLLEAVDGDEQEQW